MKRSIFLPNLKQSTFLNIFFILLLILLITLISATFASNCNDFEGQILDTHHKTPLPDVKLQVIDFTTKEVLDIQYTDEFGTYKLSIPSLNADRKIKIKLSKNHYFSTNKYLKIDELYNNKNFELEKIARTGLQDFTAEKELIKELKELNKSIEKLGLSLQKRTEQLLSLHKKQDVLCQELTSNQPSVQKNQPNNSKKINPNTQ